MDSQDIERIFTMGVVFKDSGQTRRAVALFLKVLDLNPGHGEARKELRMLPFPEN